jgi:uroporphyrin-III C-methyltransferase/precorrin-2 dehydrogenase/sirohydrochlorin ferrochelatase
MEYLPLHFDLRGKPCLLVGGVEVALRRATILLRAGADVRVVAPAIDADLSALVESSGGDCRIGSYHAGDLQQVALAIAATDDEALNRQVWQDANARQLPVNVVDRADLCSFIFPSIVDRSPVLISFSSSATSPVLSRKLREKLESLIPVSYGRLAEFVGRFRDKIKQLITAAAQRRRFWEWVMDGPVAELVLAGREAEAEQLLEQSLRDRDEKTLLGEVYLVGAGPGDPDLLTFKALRLMQNADIVLYDNLVSDGILELVRRDAKRHYVGKRRADHSIDQEDLNDMLVRLAREGKRVLRLKGGDPFIFGRGGEEIETLSENRIPFQVVPGISAANGCASYAGIPLTHRDYSQSVRFVAGQLNEGSVDLNWDELIPTNQTIVFYMGLAGLADICRQLMKHGARAETPIAVISKGTTPEQRVLTGSLDTIVELANEAGIAAPVLIIVGEVVKLHEKLRWYPDRPGFE